LLVVVVERRRLSCTADEEEEEKSNWRVRKSNSYGGENMRKRQLSRF
jgi:hypothetical protein